MASVFGIVEWESGFAAAERQWREAEQRLEKLDLELAHGQLRGWGDSLSKVEAEFDGLRRAGRWVGGPREFLDVLGRSRAELDHSAVIGWLLDPGGHHGLGTSFLEALLKIVGGTRTSNLAAARVDREVTRGGGRADIVVSLENLTVLIENKVDAQEGLGQCDWYLREFAAEPGSLFVFLTPEGRAPKSAEAKAAFEKLSYRQLHDCLETALRRAERTPGAARLVAVDYLRTLDREFPQTTTDGGAAMERIDDERVRFYLRHQDLIEQWSSLSSEVTKVADRFLRTLGSGLDAFVLELGPDVAVKEYLESDWPGFSVFRKSWEIADSPLLAEIRLEWVRSRVSFRGRWVPYVGLKAPVAAGWAKQLRTDIKDEVKGRSYIMGGATGPWIAYRQVAAPAGAEDDLSAWQAEIRKAIKETWEFVADRVETSLRGTTSARS